MDNERRYFTWAGSWPDGDHVELQHDGPRSLPGTSRSKKHDRIAITDTDQVVLQRRGPNSFSLLPNPLPSWLLQEYYDQREPLKNIREQLCLYTLEEIPLYERTKIVVKINQRDDRFQRLFVDPLENLYESEVRPRPIYKVMKLASKVPGVDLMTMDGLEKTLTVEGTKLGRGRLLWKLLRFGLTELSYIGPAAEPEKREDNKREIERDKKLHSARKMEKIHSVLLSTDDRKGYNQEVAMLRLDLNDEYSTCLKTALKLIVPRVASPRPDIFLVTRDMKDNTLTIVGEQWAHYRMCEIRDILERASMPPAKDPKENEEDGDDESKKKDDKDEDKDKDKDDHNGGGGGGVSGNSNNMKDNSNNDKKDDRNGSKSTSYVTKFIGLDAYNRWHSRTRMVDVVVMCAIMIVKVRQRGLETLSPSNIPAPP